MTRRRQPRQCLLAASRLRRPPRQPHHQPAALRQRTTSHRRPGHDTADDRFHREDTVTLRIKLFGSLELEREGQCLSRFPSRKCGELFAYLAINRRDSHTREHLAGVFWGDSTEERARHALNTTLWRINRVLEAPGTPPNERGY